MVSTRLLGLISLMMATACGAASAQQGTDQQREACTPDAFRLCMSAMPDAGRVEGCLRAAGPRLSPACAAVFNPPQTEQMIAQGRDRRAPREVQQREVQQRDRDSGQRYDRPREYRDNQERDYQSRQPRDSFLPPPRDDDD